MTDDRSGAPPPVTAPVRPWPGEQPPLPPPPPRGGPPRWLLAVAAGTAVASVAAFLLGLLWPIGGDRSPAGPLAFHGFAHVGQLRFEEPSQTGLTTVQGQRGFVGWERSGNLRLSAVDLATGEQLWQQTVSGAPRWGRLIATPQVLVVLAHEFDTSAPRKLFVRDPGTGEQRWEIDVRGDDRLYFSDRTMIWFDLGEEALRGLDLVSGEQRWSQPLERGARVLPVTTAAGLAQPTDTGGAASPLGDDRRLVVVHADRTVRVLDGYDGAELGSRVNVANPGDLLLAYEERLFVLPRERGYRVEAYQLTALGEPTRAIYAATDLDRIPDALEPCGAGRVCVLDTVLFDRLTAQVTAVDVADGGAVWQQEQPGAQRLLPVGEWLAVATVVDFTDQVVLLDGEGVARHTQPGSALRLNDGNLLLVDTGWESATGFALEHAEAIGLGPFPDVASTDGCAWSDHLLVCAGREALDIWRFASD